MKAQLQPGENGKSISIKLATMIPPSILEQIRNSNDIVEVIGSYIPLKRSGANYMALCPFHKEKTPSFSVSPQKQIFHCFGCGKGGDVFMFVREFEHVSFTEAAIILAKRAGIQVEFSSNTQDQQSKNTKDALLQIHEEITKLWQTNLIESSAAALAREYVKKRNISNDALHLFRIGYAIDSWDATLQWATKKDIPLNLLELAGLIIKKENGDGYYDRFRGRLMFPICDELGRVIGFSGRIITGDEKTAKYINSPETPIFTKGKVIFGLDKSKKFILENKSAIVCEGQLDMISCFMAGIKNVVAPLGTALTADHARIIKRYTDEVILCFDADSAGQKATIRALDELIESGLSIKVLSIPSPHDPDSYIQSFGPEQFQTLVKNARAFFDFYLDYLCAQNDVSSDLGKITIARSMAQALEITGHPILFETYLQKTAIKLGISHSTLLKEFKRNKFRKKTAPNLQLTNETPSSDDFIKKIPEKEIWLLKLIGSDKIEIDWLAKYLNTSWIQNATVRHIVAAVIQAHLSNQWSGLPGLISIFQDHESQALLASVLADNREIPEPQKQIQELVLYLRNLEIERQLNQILALANKNDLPDPEQKELISKRMKLMALKNQPLSPVNKQD